MMMMMMEKKKIHLKAHGFQKILDNHLIDRIVVH